MQILAKDPSPVSFSLSLYQFLLATYPAGFRREYGPHMVQVFRDYCLRIYNLDGSPGLLRLWILTLLDYFKTVVEEHLNQGVHMSKSKFIRLSGWALALGATAFTVVLIAIARDVPEYSRYNALSQPIDLYFEYAVTILIPSSMLFWFVGMIGLYLRFREELNQFVRITLILGMIGTGINTLLTSVWWSEQVSFPEEFSVFIAGITTFSLSLVLFGIVSMRVQLLPRGNALPIIAGSWVLIIWLLNILGLNGYFEQIGVTIVFALSLPSMLGLAALGIILGSDSREMVSAT